MKRCPVCATELKSEMRVVETNTTWVEHWTCPNAEMHGRTVECANGCGEQVPNPKYHYSYTPGVLGSGRWSCFKRLDLNELRPLL